MKDGDKGEGCAEEEEECLTAAGERGGRGRGDDGGG